MQMVEHTSVQRYAERDYQSVLTIEGLKHVLRVVMGSQ